MIYDLRIHQVLYEKEVTSSMSMSFVNGSEISSLPSMTYTHEMMIDEIQLNLSTKNKPGEMFHEFRQHMMKNYGKYSMDYPQTEIEYIDYTNGMITPSAPEYVTLKIESGGIPYSFLSKYRDRVLSMNIIFVKLAGAIIGSLPRVIELENGHTAYNRYVSYTRPLNIYPYHDLDFYLDKELTRPIRHLFIPSTNKEAKKQARLESFDD
jgi:hypothetical protein